MGHFRAGLRVSLAMCNGNIALSGLEQELELGLQASRGWQLAVAIADWL